MNSELIYTATILFVLIGIMFWTNNINIIIFDENLGTTLQINNKENMEEFDLTPINKKSFVFLIIWGITIVITCAYLWNIIFSKTNNL